MPSKCCNALIDYDDDGDLICTECLALCEILDLNFDDIEFQDSFNDDDLGGTGHGDISHSDADPGL